MNLLSTVKFQIKDAVMPGLVQALAKLKALSNRGLLHVLSGRAMALLPSRACGCGTSLQFARAIGYLRQG